MTVVPLSANRVGIPRPPVTIRPMRRRWWLVGGLAVVAGIAAAAAPSLVHGRIVDGLHHAGYPTARVGGVSLSPWSATIHDLALDDRGTLTVQRLVVRWSWSGLIHGRLQAVHGEGVALSLAPGPTGPAWTALLPEQKNAEKSAKNDDFPIDAVGLAGTVAVGRLTLPLTAELHDLGGGRLWLAAAAGADTAPRLAVSGTLGGGGPDLSATIDGVPLLAWAGALVEPPPAAVATLPPVTASGELRWRPQGVEGRLRLGGPWGALDVLGRGQAAQGSVHVVARGLDVAALRAAAQPWYPRLPVEGLDGRADVLADGTWEGQDWSLGGALDATRLTANHPQVRLTAGALRLEGRVASRQGVRSQAGSLLVTGAVAVAQGLSIALPEVAAGIDGEQWHLRANAGAEGATAQLAVAGDATTLHGRVVAGTVDLAAWQRRVAALEEPLRVSVPLRLNGSAGVEARFERSGAAWSGTAQLTVDRAAISGADWSLDAARLGAEGSFAVVPGQPPSAQVVARISEGSATAAGLMVAALNGTLPWSQGRDPGITGDLRGDVTAHGVTVPGLRLRARLVDQHMDARLTGRLFGLLDGLAEGTVDLAAPGGPQVHLRVAVPRTVLRDAAALAAAAPVLGPWRLTGAVAAAGTIDVRAGVVTPDLRLVVEDAQVERPDLALRLEGVRSAVAVSSFAPLRVVSDQPLTVRRIAWKNELAEHLEGSLAVAGEHLGLRDVSLQWGGGSVAMPQLEADLAPDHASGTASAELAVTGVGLDAVLAVAAPGRISGAGRLVGRMPVSLTWPEVRVTLGAGHLAADPPQGWVRIADRRPIAAAIGTGGMADARLRERLVDAVQEFAFSRLEATTTRDGDNLLTRITVAGRGRAGEDPLELGGLTFNIRGVEEALAEAIRFGRTPPPQPPADDTLDRFFGK